MTDPAGNERTRDPEQHGDDAATGILARHQQLGDGAGEAANNDPADDPVFLHWLALSAVVLVLFYRSFNGPSL
jgi:hypothetical protein